MQYLSNLQLGSSETTQTANNRRVPVTDRLNRRAPFYLLLLLSGGRLSELMLPPIVFMTSRDQKCKLHRQNTSKDSTMGVLVLPSNRVLWGLCTRKPGKISLLSLLAYLQQDDHFLTLLLLNQEQEVLLSLSWHDVNVKYAHLFCVL